MTGFLGGSLSKNMANVPYCYSEWSIMNFQDQVVTVMTNKSGPGFGSENFEKGYLMSQASIRENTV